jgi:hypothetical protein
MQITKKINAKNNSVFMHLNQISSLQEKQHTPRVSILLERNSVYTIHILDETETIIDVWLFEYIDEIPYFSRGSVINSGRSDLISGLQNTNYSTLIAICQKFLNFQETYWNDNTSKTRDFRGIMELIEKRLWELWYTVLEREAQHYIDDDNMKRIFIPTKIVPIS